MINMGGRYARGPHYCMRVINLTRKYFILNFRYNGSAHVRRRAEQSAPASTPISVPGRCFVFSLLEKVRNSWGCCFVFLCWNRCGIVVVALCSLCWNRCGIGGIVALYFLCWNRCGIGWGRCFVFLCLKRSGIGPE